MIQPLKFTNKNNISFTSSLHGCMMHACLHPSFTPHTHSYLSIYMEKPNTKRMVIFTMTISKQKKINSRETLEPIHAFSRRYMTSFLVHQTRVNLGLFTFNTKQYSRLFFLPFGKLRKHSLKLWFSEYINVICSLYILTWIYGQCNGGKNDERNENTREGASERIYEGPVVQMVWYREENTRQGWQPAAVKV